MESHWAIKFKVAPAEWLATQICTLTVTAVVRDIRRLAGRFEAWGMVAAGAG